MMPAKWESVRRKRRTRRRQDLERGSSGVKNRKTRNLRALRQVLHILELRKIGSTKRTPQEQDGNGVSLWKAISRGHLFPGKCQNGANCKSINRRCDRELGMCSLEKSMFCKARSMVFKHAHNVHMAPKELHQVHVQKSYREADVAQHGTLFKAMQS